MARNGIIAFVFLFSIQSALAEPFDLGTRIVVQPDGTSFIVNELVDEFGHYVSAEKGYVVQNQSTGYYYYARYDTVGHKAPTSLRVGRDDEADDVIRLTHYNYVWLQGVSRFFQGRVRVRSEIGQPLPAIYLAALCANGIAVPEPQDNRGLVKDCEVLLAVRDSLAGLRGTPLNWSADLPISDWVGVTVSNGRVTELVLGARHLMGTISPRLAQLSEMTVLLLHGNTLTGTIPPELGQLTQLRMLGLEFNELTGAIPPELGQLSELKWLFLGYNGLTGAIPPEVGQLGRLEHLALNDNALTGAIPPELGRLGHLEHLALHGNALTQTIPPELGQLLHLKNLSLNDNALTGTIPPELATLTKLVRLNLDTNQLQGPIPSEIGQIDHLESLWLGDNTLTGTIPPELGQLTQLRALSLHNNELTGTIPPELAKLRELKVLISGHNALTGTIPPELGQLNHLEGLYLSNNALTGPIPPELATLTELKYLHLAFNQLTGSIPPELGQPTGLLQLNLYSNRLTCVPEALAKWADDLPLCPDLLSASDETATSMEVVSQNLPTTSGLSPNYPNPFNASTQIAYDIAASGPVRLTIYNTLGQPVRTLVDQFQAAGSHQVRWDARDQQGAALAAGVYLVRLRYPGGEQTRRLLLLK